MPDMSVAVEVTTGSDMGLRRTSAVKGTERLVGHPVGRGAVLGTLGRDGRPVDAMVLMTEPALPGAEVRARAVALLHLRDQADQLDEVLAVAEGVQATDLTDVGDLDRWKAEPGKWAAARDRMMPGLPTMVTGCECRVDAERVVCEARDAFFRMTGCLE